MLVGNAGIKVVHEPHEVILADYDRVMAVNLRGAFLCAQAAVQHLLDSRRPGAIVMTSSIEAHFPVEEGAIAYIMSKSGLDRHDQGAGAPLRPGQHPGQRRRTRRDPHADERRLRDATRASKRRW